MIPLFKRKPVNPDFGFLPLELGYPDLDPAARERRRSHRMATALSVLTLVAVVALAAQGPSDSEQLTPEPDLCNAATVPVAEVAFLVDTTDPLSPDHIRVVSDKILHTRDALPAGSRLTVMRLDPDGGGALAKILFSACKPADGHGANPWTENARLLKLRYQEDFVQPLDGAVAALAEPLPGRTSPLLEALHEIAESKILRPDIPNRRLVILSDMLQNSPLLSHFRRGYSFKKLEQQGSFYLTGLDGLAGVEVIVYQLRDRYARHQTKGHTRFWEEYFLRAGVRDIQVARL